MGFGKLIFFLSGRPETRYCTLYTVRSSTPCPESVKSSWSPAYSSEEEEEGEEVRPVAKQPAFLESLNMGLECEDVDLTIMKD